MVLAGATGATSATWVPMTPLSPVFPKRTGIFSEGARDSYHYLGFLFVLLSRPLEEVEMLDSVQHLTGKLGVPWETASNEIGG